MAVGEEGEEVAQEIDEQLRRLRVGARDQVSLSLPASSLDHVITRGPEDNGLGLGHNGPATQGGLCSGGHQ
jgi:hypothetical protein